MTILWQLVGEPMSFAFMQRALLVAVIIASTCALLSCYLVLKGWALMGDAVSHAILPGIVAAYVVKLPLVVGAFATGFLCAIATGFIKSNSRVREDTVLGIVFAGLFALGILLFVKIETDQHLTHVLFGNILGTRWDEIALLAAVCIVVSGVLLVFQRTILLFVFDPSQAQTLGLPNGLLHYGLLVLLAATSVAAMKSVGVVLVVAMLVTPGAIGFLLARRFPGMVLWAWTSAMVASIGGVFLSFHFDIPTGPLIVVLQFAFFVAALIRNQTMRPLADEARA